jgi:L-ascorbate metabolism protein UlaG (beta-lactamase superfamily)
MELLKTFGKIPSEESFPLFSKYKNFAVPEFKNLSETIMMMKGFSMIKIAWNFFFNKPKNVSPPGRLPSVKTDLKNLPRLSSKNPVIVWFGHSSYLIYIHGLHILVDPVFSGHASPFSFTTKSFPGADIYGVDDLPSIDLLILTHDHYDHLDYETVRALQQKTKSVCTSLGVGSHLKYWGWEENEIHELGWGDEYKLPENIQITACSARHFSGRSFTRNRTLWSSFVLDANGYKLYVGGDSGYDTHFQSIGEKYGPFDIVILEAGQYNENWPLIHMMPEQTVQAAVDLRAKLLLPVHWGKFSLSMHPWNDSPNRVRRHAQTLSMPVTIPMIGEPVILNESSPNRPWWVD